MRRCWDLKNYQNIQQLFGPLDKNIQAIEKKFKVNAYLADSRFCLEGKKGNLEKAVRIIEALKKGEISAGQLSLGMDLAKNKGLAEDIEKIKAGRNSFIYPRSANQQKYVRAIRKHDLVFVVGPAGSGKTYLAMAMAVEFLQMRKVKRIIMTRPAIEAGESLGYLPGGIAQKLNPYLRPLYDALYEMLPASAIEEYLKSGVIEVAPLAYMRGRTLSEAFVILDEAQNCTQQQLKMFLTRFGQNSKVVVTGDITQTDLPHRRPLGFLATLRILKKIKGISFVSLDSSDIVRHPLVRKIVEAYEKDKRKKLS